jgi:flagellar hook-basal body complex protein FliE
MTLRRKTMCAAARSPDDTEEHKQRGKETYEVLKEATDKVKAKLEAATPATAAEVEAIEATV